MKVCDCCPGKCARCEDALRKKHIMSLAIAHIDCSDPFWQDVVESLWNGFDVIVNHHELLVSHDTDTGEWALVKASDAPEDAPVLNLS